MDDLLAIGAFSELTGLSVKALRLYDRRGLLRTALVDFESGYRYYRRDQAQKAERIRVLRRLGLPLSEVPILLDAEDRDVIGDFLNQHRARLQDRLRETEQALELLPSVEEWHDHKGEEDAMNATEKTHQCSFCSKWNTEVRRMIAGPGGVIICNECVALCDKIIAREEKQEAQGRA